MPLKNKSCNLNSTNSPILYYFLYLSSKIKQYSYIASLKDTYWFQLVIYLVIKPSYNLFPCNQFNNIVGNIISYSYIANYGAFLIARKKFQVVLCILCLALASQKGSTKSNKWCIFLHFFFFCCHFRFVAVVNRLQNYM